MTEIEIKKKNSEAEVFVEGEKLGSLTPQELWDLSEELREFAISNASGFSAEASSEIRVNNLEFNVLPLPHADFWSRVNRREWEPETYAVFDRFLDYDTVFLDIGAWIGSTSLYGAQIASETHAFEPDPVSFAELCANFQSNRDAHWFSKMQIHQKAVAATSGKMRIGSKSEGGDSMSSVLFQEEKLTWKVDSVDLTSFTSEYNLDDKPLFLKIDIEGGEYQLIPGMRSFFQSRSPVVLISLHPEFLIGAIRKRTRGVLKGLRVRWAFFKNQFRLIRSLPFAHLEHADGRTFHARKYLLKALITGTFPHTIICYNE